MPNITPIQSDFSAGEISKRLQGNVQSQSYQGGLDLIENFEVTPQGSLEFRGGTEYQRDLLGSTQDLITFIRDVGDDYLVVVDSEYVSVLGTDNQLFSITDVDPLQDEKFEQGFRYWTVNKFQEPADPIYGSVVTPISGSGVRALLYNDPDRSTTPPITPLTEVSVAQAFQKTGNNGQLMNLTYDITLDFESGFDVNSGAYAVRVTDTNSERLLFERDVPIPNQRPPFASGGKVSFSDSHQFPLSNGDVTIIFYFVNNDDPNATNVWTSIEFELTNIRLTPNTPSTGSSRWPTPADWMIDTFNIKKLQFCQDSAQGIMFFTANNGDPYYLNNPRGNQWEFKKFDPATRLPNQFTENKPAACTIHQGRLWLGGGDTNGNALAASETFNYFNFEVPEVPLPNSPLDFRLSTNGSIQWLEGIKNLLIGTDRGEVIGRSSGASITGSDFNFSLEQTWGCAQIQPLEVGNKVMYVTGAKTRLRALYDQGDSTNGYGSADITYQIQSTFNQEIVDMAFQKNPDYLVYLVLADGSMLVSTYFEAGEVNAWARYVTDGMIKSVTTKTEAEGTVLYMSVERANRFGGIDLFLERKNPITAIGLNLDCYTEQTVMPSEKIENLERYVPFGPTGFDRSRICAIVLLNEGYQLFDAIILNTDDGYYWEVPEYVPSGATVYIGVRYDGKIRTLPIEGSSKIGTAQVQKRRFNEIFLRVFDSGIPKVNGYYPAIRTPANNMNLSQALFSGDTSIYDSGYGDGVIEINQELPLPLNITAIFGKLKGSAI